MKKEKLRLFLLEEISDYWAEKKIRQIKDYGADCSDLHQKLTDRIHNFYEVEEIKEKIFLRNKVREMRKKDGRWPVYNEAIEDILKLIK